jgi:hypothetical protein
LTASPSATESATPTPSGTPSFSGTVTLTASPSATPTETFTISPTFTASPTVTPTPIPTIGSFLVDVLDANMNVVSRLTVSGGAGLIASLQLSKSTYVPETDGPLTVTADQGGQGLWYGLGLDNKTQLPNGYYRIRLLQSGQSPVEASFWIKHQEYSGGSMVVLQSPVKSGAPVLLSYGYPEMVSLEFRTYNLAGELVSQASTVGVSGVMPISFKTSGGQDVAAGIYLIQVRGTTVQGGAEFLKLLKVAVIR